MTLATIGHYTCPTCRKSAEVPLERHGDAVVLPNIVVCSNHPGHNPNTWPQMRCEGFTESFQRVA